MNADTTVIADMGDENEQGPIHGKGPQRASSPIDALGEAASDAQANPPLHGTGSKSEIEHRLKGIAAVFGIKYSDYQRLLMAVWNEARRP